ncbi:MAG: ABC transporter permease, partial [Chloroflexi bacterium]|nr:ABC transporter permease [Chloroflexota bacterium]
YTLEELQDKVRQVDDWLDDELEWTFDGIDARELQSNLPGGEFAEGGQLSADNAMVTGLDGEQMPGLVIAATEATFEAGISVGDELTLAFDTPPQPIEVVQMVLGREVPPPTITFKVVGLLDKRGGQVTGFSNSLYASRGTFGGLESDSLNFIANVQDSEIGTLRAELNQIDQDKSIFEDRTLTFVLETAALNELLSRMIEAFTSFPILVASLALFTGGVVIANSVALSTMERRREIAIMKAVGLQRERVLGMLLLENGIMGLIGGLLGVGIGVILLSFMLGAMFSGSDLDVGVPYGTAFMLMGLCILIALFAAILTAWGASGEKPLNVLRYE